MTEGTKTRRLSKVAREFNVGLTTIVEFLNKKGIAVDNNPNAKISGEAYELLFQEFQSEKTLKEASRKAGLNILKRESISMDQDERVAREKEEKKAADEELFIKDMKAPAAEEKPIAKKAAPAPAEMEKEEKEAGKTEEKPPIPEAASEAEKPQAPVPEEKAAAAEISKRPAAEKEEEAAGEQAISPEAAEKTALEESAIEKADKTGLKIVGRIDLDEAKTARKTKKKAPQKAAEEEKKEAPAPPGAGEEPPAAAETKEAGAEEAADEQKEGPEKDHHRTQFRKLDGPTILGKMDLPEPREAAKKPVASSSDTGKAKKRKRKRIKKDKPPEGQLPPTDQKTTGADTGRARKGVRKDYVRPEVSEEEISRQIRETLANLSGTGKSKAAKYRRMKRDVQQQQKEKEREQEVTGQKVLQVTEFISAAELANMMNISVNEIIATCMSLGLFVSINQRLDAETISIVADEFGFDVEFVSADSQEDLVEKEPEDPAKLRDRAPIVTVMGHVDHGKTSLLDQIRHSNIIAGEAGGITQHIGAYAVKLDNGKTITFLDTPGHEAFTAMRARGAKVTDVAIIVVAADDSVMPQTVEAINHAQAAGVPIVIAINKIDKENAAPEKVKEGLANMNILVEDWGGKYQSQEISAKAGQNIEGLLEKVLLESEMLELKANPSKNASGTVIESALDKGRGYVSTVLVQNGTLKVGGIVVAGTSHGKVKAMFNERGHRIHEAGPSTPVLILGLDSAPQAGDTFRVVQSESEAKTITTKRQQLIREQGLRTQKHITLDEIGRRIAIGDFKELNIIVKGDVDGSVEALSDSLLKLSSDEIQVNIIHKAVGPVTEGDVLLASASNAIIIGFQVRPSVAARKLAENEQIDIRLYSIIYNAINEIKSAIEGMLSPEIEEKVLANLEVREVFKITKVGTVAGCMVLDGKIQRNSSIRLIRDGIVVYTGKLGSLKRFKEDVKEVSAGYECGLNIERFNDIKVGDIIEAFETIEIARKLD